MASKRQPRSIDEKNHIVSNFRAQKRILVGIPMTGLIRSEWHLAYIAQIIPCNWSQHVYSHIYNHYTPLRFLVADARNLIVQKAVKEEYEWLFFIDHDVILPHNTFAKWNERLRKADVPIFGGLYFTKSLPAEPLIYRGRGNSYYSKWKLGTEVWCDGMGLGCHVIHVSILKYLYENSLEYTIKTGDKTYVTAREVFVTPFESFRSSGGFFKFSGTEDLPFYERIIKEDVFKKIGWKIKRKYPFLCDTSIFCKHIDQSGRQFPMAGEENEFKA